MEKLYDASRFIEAVASVSENRFAKIEGDLTLLKWMVAVNTGFVIFIATKLLL